jgi:hypothetical protein
MRVSRVCAVVPAQNEEESIQNVYRQIHRAGITACVTVVNGSTDKTEKLAQELAPLYFRQHREIVFPDALGPDVPRAIGAYAVLREFPDIEWVVLVDGDWKGSFGPDLEQCVDHARTHKLDVQFVTFRHPTEQQMLSVQTQRPDETIWRSITERHAPSLFGSAPSYAPMVVSRTALCRVSPYWLHHPGRWFTYVLWRFLANDLSVGVFDNWDVRSCGNQTRNRLHNQNMQKTIFGDALEALCMIEGLRPTRWFRGVIQDGYHTSRRLDVLQAWQNEADIRAD